MVTRDTLTRYLREQGCPDADAHVEMLLLGKWQKYGKPNPQCYESFIPTRWVD